MTRGAASSRWLRRGTYLAVAVIVAVAGACSPPKKSVQLTLTLDAIADPDGSGVLLIGTGVSCGDISLQVTQRTGNTFTLAGRGTLPKNPNDYCERYIDTGGENESPKTGRKSVDVREGAYVVKAARGADSLSFVYRNGIVATSRLTQRPSPTIDEVAERLARQRDLTIQVVDRLRSVLRDSKRLSCEQDPATAHFTRCEVKFGTALGLELDRPPLPPAATTAAGCTLSDVALIRYGMTCELTNAGAVLQVRLRDWGGLSDTQTVLVWVEVR